MVDIILVLKGLWPHLLAPAMFLFLFTLPPFPIRGLLFLTAFHLFFSLCFIPLSVPLGGIWQIGLALVWLTYLDWFAKMMLHMPERDFWRIGAHPQEAGSMGFGQRKLM